MPLIVLQITINRIGMLPNLVTVDVPRGHVLAPPKTIEKNAAMRQRVYLATPLSISFCR